jgi:hypothetical protein
MNALLQSFRQLLLRVPSGVMPKSQRCPLALPLQQHAFSADEIAQWQCWMYLPVGTQRDACHVLEMCLDCQGPMHSGCLPGDCYGELLRNITSFDLTRDTICGGCQFASQETKSQCVLHVESDTGIESAMRASLAVCDIEDYTCESCFGNWTRQQTRLGDLPQFLVVHVNKHAQCIGPKTEAIVRLSGKELQRVAVLHHTGHSPESGHYTCTLTTEGGQTYHCNDETISSKLDLSELSWQNSYLVFLQVKPHGDAQHTEDHRDDVSLICDAHPAEDDMECASDRGDALNVGDDDDDDGIDRDADGHILSNDEGSDDEQSTRAPARAAFYRVPRTACFNLCATAYRVFASWVLPRTAPLQLGTTAYRIFMR